MLRVEPHAIRHHSSPSLLTRLTIWAALARQRRALADLDANQLRDIGVDPEAARREAARPFWDAPHHWMG